MKKYSIGYTDNYGDFVKVNDEKGNTKKFETVEEAKRYIKNDIKEYLNNKCGALNNMFKVMQGWNIITIIPNEEMN